MKRITPGLVGPVFRIMWLGGVIVSWICGTVHQCWQYLKPKRYCVSCNKAATIMIWASGNLAIAVRGPCDCPKSFNLRTIFFCPNVHLQSCVFCTISARPPRGARAVICNATYDMSTVYGLTIFSNLYNFSLNKTVEAAAPVNPYENLTPMRCSCQLLTASSLPGTISSSSCGNWPPYIT